MKKFIASSVLLLVMATLGGYADEIAQSCSTLIPVCADDQVVVWDTTWSCKTVPDCDADNQTLAYDQTTNAFSCGDDDTGSSSNALLDGSAHTDTTNSAVTAGDLVYGNSTPAWDDLAIGSPDQVLTVISGAPAWAPPASTGGGDGSLSTLQFDRKLMFEFPGATNGTMQAGAGVDSESTGTGTAEASPNIGCHMSVRRCGTTVGSVCNYTTPSPNVNHLGAIRHRADVTWQFGISASAGDENDYRFVVGIGDVAGAEVLPTNSCSTAGGTDNFAFYALCYDKSVQANWLKCSGDGSDWDCDDTGIAVDDETDLVCQRARIDTRDMANIKYYINGASAGTRTTLLPAANTFSALERIVGIRINVAVTQVKLLLGSTYVTWD